MASKRPPLGLVLLATLAATAPAATLLEPGFTDVFVGTIPAMSSTYAGAIVEDDGGNLYVVGATVPEVFRKTPSGVFASWLTIPGTRCIGAAISGNTLYVGMTDGNIFTMDVTSGTPTPVLFGSTASAAQGLSLSCSPPSLLVGFAGGIMSFDLGTGVGTSIYSTTNIPSIACPGGGATLLCADWSPNQIIEITPPGGAVVFHGPTAADPDGIRIHPGTGFIYIATSQNDILQKLDPTGTTLTDFATSIVFSNGSYPTPLRFSRDGTRLYYGTQEMSVYTIRAIEGFPSLSSCAINTPAPGAVESDDVAIDFDADSGVAATVTIDFDYSVDGGATWSPCTAAPTSAHPNPSGAVAVPAAGEVFTWDSLGDGVGVAMIETATMRLTVDGMQTCTVAFDLDNTALCQLTCGDCNLLGGPPDIIDALTAAQLAAALLFPTMAQTGCCDVNANGVIDVIDALRIAQEAVGLSPGLVCL